MFEKVSKLIAEQFSVESDTITMETSFKEDLNADSLDIVELTMALEEEFELGEIEDDDLMSLATVGDAVNFVQGKVG